MRVRQTAALSVPPGVPCVPAHAEARHLDITNGSGLVTVSWSRFAGHDKAVLIGSSDAATEDRGSAPHPNGTPADRYPVDLLALHTVDSRGSERHLTADAGWTPTPHGKTGSARAAGPAVARGAGAGRIP
ncbi:pectate lyase family protein [Streptomyces tricolor]|uniref:pectate lyase family protein n=1 Tax=Streptomyces tricolor TaxID=68277 RepID=UPI0036EB9BA1